MYKYQEALERAYICGDNDCCDCKFNEICINDRKGWYGTLKELVDKATPKKPIIKQYKNSEHYLCPNCKNYRFGIIDYGEYKNEWRKGSELMPYCPKCGQAIDRSDENDK